MHAWQLVLIVVFGAAGFQEARRFGRTYGRTPWGWDPWIWAAICAFSFLIGVILLAISERIGRAEAKQRAAYGAPMAGGMTAAYGVPMAGGMSAAYGAPMAGGMSAAYGAPNHPNFAPVAASVATAVAAPAAALPAPKWAADPSGRHQYRWWDGARWTEHVSTNGAAGFDPAR